MLVDTHCHLNIMIKENFDIPITKHLFEKAQQIIDDAAQSSVSTIINVGTSLIESKNSVMLAKQFPHVYATVGIHPNDCTPDWKTEFAQLKEMVHQPENKIVGIGECGIDRHYPDYNLQRQYDAFKAHIELALENNLALVIHSRDAYDETLRVIEEFAKNNLKGTMHCFSYDQSFADQTIAWGMKIGLGGTLTYPKNNELRAIAQTIDLSHIVLETDAPFLPIQSMRGKQNHPQYIKEIAQYLATLKAITFDQVAHQTTTNALTLFGLHQQ